MCSPEFITVLMATHNRLELLRPSVESVLGQDHRHFLLLIVDDGSDDETQSWLVDRAKDHPRMQVQLRQHRGVAATRQEALQASDSKWVTILDSDDLLEKWALKRISEEIHAHPTVDLLYTNNVELLAGGGRRQLPYPEYATCEAMIRGVFLRPRVPFKHSGTTFRRSVALQLGGYDLELPLKVDIDLFLRFLSAGKQLHLVNDPLVVFRMYSSSLSSRRFEGIRVWWKLIDRYGPASRVERLGIQVRRTLVELLKAAYARTVLRDYR